jgi:thiazole tautomerase (transcriptional regulator TenI)
VIPRLHLISDRRICSLERLPDVALAAVRGGVDAIHVRERGLPAGELLRVVREVRRSIGDEVALLVNDRLDVALLGGANGVQLPESGLPARDVRGRFGSDVVIGRSVHDVAGAVRAERDGADFVVAGHVYVTGSKTGQPGRGVPFIRDVSASVGIPVIAIGGITPARVREVMAAGASGVAVISGILSSGQPEQAARDYRLALNEFSK